MNEAQDYTEWDKCFVLGIPIIDRQHDNLLRICNNLHWTCLKGQETINGSFVRTAHEALDHLKHHFSTEEKMMKILSFSEFSAHKKEHDNFIIEILNCFEQIESGEQFAPNLFARLVKDWLLSHFTSYDRAFADSILSMSNYGKLKLTLTGEYQLSAYSGFNPTALKPAT